MLSATKYPNTSRSVSGTYTVDDQDVILLCDTSSGVVNITLQTIPEDYFSTQYKLYIIDNSNNAATNNITINAPSGYKINGQNSIVLDSNGASVIISISANTKYLAVGVQQNNPAGLTSLPVKNTVFVMKNGSDTTGLVERFDKPFLTIAAARAAAVAAFTPSATNRILIKVFSGNYAEQIILVDYIDYDLSDITLSQVVSGTLITDNGIAVNSIVYVKANLISTFLGLSTGYSINITNSGSNVYVYLNNITMTGATGMIIGAQSTGNLYLYCNDIYCENIGAGIIFGIQPNMGSIYALVNNVTVKNINGVAVAVGSSGGTSKMYMRANNLHSEGGDSSNGLWTVSVQAGGVLDLECNDITCIPTSASTTRGWCIGMGGVGGIGVVRCNKVVCSPTINESATCINFGSSGSSGLTAAARLTVICTEAKINAIATTNSVIRQENADTDARFYFKGRAVVSGSVDTPVIKKNTGVMILDDVTLVGAASTTNSITCPSANNVYVYGGVSNRPVDANTSQLVSNLLIDSNVI
jgi:hypothetical protein